MICAFFDKMRVSLSERGCPIVVAHKQTMVGLVAVFGEGGAFGVTNPSFFSGGCKGELQTPRSIRELLAPPRTRSCRPAQSGRGGRKRSLGRWFWWALVVGGAFACDPGDDPSGARRESTGGSGGSASGGSTSATDGPGAVGGRTSYGICGPGGPLPASACASRSECGHACQGDLCGVYSYRMNNPYGENCVCRMEPVEYCASGCDEGSGLCLVGGAAGASGDAP